jgi:hypothetical protein
MPGWIKTDEGTYSAIATKPNGSCCNLTVEKKKGADGRWEWWACRADGPTTVATSCGHAHSVLDAMKQAERAI